MFQAGFPLTKRLLNFVYKVGTLSPVSSFLLFNSENWTSEPCYLRAQCAGFSVAFWFALSEQGHYLAAVHCTCAITVL